MNWRPSSSTSPRIAFGPVAARHEALRKAGPTASAQAGIFAILLGCILLPGCGGVVAAPEAATAAPAKAASDGSIAIPANSPKLNLVRVAPVSKGEFELAEVAVPGEIEANPNRVSHVLTPVTGRIREVLVHLGDSVTEGQPLAVIESADATAALAAQMEAEAQIRQARSALLKSQQDLARVRELYRLGAVALKEVQAAENDGVQAQAALDQAQAAEAAAAQRLKTLGLEPGQHSSLVRACAPIGGKVMEIAVAPGEYWDDPTASLMTITDLRTVWMSALVPETRIRYIDVGEAVRAEFAAYPGEVFRARVMRISDAVDPQTRTIRVESEIANPNVRLRLGMFGQFHHLHPLVSEPAVPVGAVIETSGQSVVYVEERPGVFCERTITTGERQDGMFPVLTGLSAGERIVVDGVMLLHTEKGTR
jgi:cobalt-zinc-cadmium efflux system membrane fusion protein